MTGALLANHETVLGTVGIACLGYGIGFSVAGIWLVIGHNPLDRHTGIAYGGAVAR